MTELFTKQKDEHGKTIGFIAANVTEDPGTTTSRTSLVDLVKKNIAALGATVTIISASAGAVMAIESRYAKAADVEGIKQYVVQSREYSRYETRQGLDTLRKQQLEDKLFELRLKKNPTPLERALIQRYEDQLNETNSRLNQAPPAQPSMDITPPK